MSTLSPPYFGVVDELPEERTGTAFGGFGPREYTRVFLVEALYPEMGPIDVCMAPGLPRRWSFYINAGGVSWDTQALLQRAEATPDGTERGDGGRQWWKVRCFYTTDLPELPAGVSPSAGGGPAGQSPAPHTPEGEPPTVSWSFIETTRASALDRDGNPFVTSAGQPFDPPPAFPVCYPVLRMTRNEYDYNPTKAEYYSYSLNSKPFLGYPRGWVQCMTPSAEMRRLGTVPYWRVSYQLKMYTPMCGDAVDMAKRIAAGDLKPGDDKYEDWQPAFLDKGTMLRDTRKTLPDGAGGEKPNPDYGHASVPIPTTGHGPSGPRLLDGRGGVLKPVHEIGVGGLPDGFFYEPKYRRFQVYPYFDFRLLIERGFGGRVPPKA